MRPLRAISLAALLAGCAQVCPAPPPLPVPVGLKDCPDPISEPAMPPAPRTVDQLGAWALHSAAVARANNLALRECAGRLAKLNALIGHPRDH